MGILHIGSSLITLGTIIKCEECKHNDNSAYVWADSNDDTYFTGNSLEELAQFLITHALPQTTRAFYLQSPAPAICKCGHGFGDHSFYGETRGECHGEMIVNGEANDHAAQCDCTYFERR